MARPRKSPAEVPATDQLAPAEVPATVRMVRDEPQKPGGPTAADVHPDEVGNWTGAGWRTA